jgi:hypothetical protein
MPDAVDYTQVVASFLTQRLKNDPTLDALVHGRIYDSDLPQADSEAERAALYNCVMFNADSFGRAVLGNGDTIVWTPGDFRVFGIAQGRSFLPLVPISARLFQLLHGFFGPVPGGGYINSCTFLRSVKEAPPGEGGLTFRHLGILVRIRARLSAS